MKAKRGAKVSLRAKALKTLQKLARIAAADDNGYAQCVSCGRTQHYKEMDGGHFIPKGSSSRWALEEQNVHPQCKGCNGFGMKHGSAEAQYTIWMIDYYGKDAVEEMLATKKEPVKYYASDYRQMIEGWGQQIIEHERRIGERR